MHSRIAITLALSLLAAAASPLPAQAAAPQPATLNGLESSVTIYSYPPRHPIDWRSPRKALRTFFGNLLRVAIGMNQKVEFVSDYNEHGTMSSNFKSSMGHAIGHIHCRLPNGQVYDRWSSLSGQDLRAADKMVLVENQLGLGALFFDYLDGHIISGQENKMRITHYKGNKVDGERIRPRYMQFEVSAQSCQDMKDMVDFFEGFHFKKGTTLEQLQRIQKTSPEKLLYFTNTMDPYDSYVRRKTTGKGLVGGGCAPYGAALLKVAGLFRPEFDTLWKTNLSISEALIGGLRDRATGEIRRVSLRKLLLGGLGSYWDYSEDGYKNRPLSLYDPQRFWQFTGDVLACVRNASYCGGKTKALVDSERSLITRGQVRVFRGAPDEDGEPSDVVQRVDGFIWRLR